MSEERVIRRRLLIDGDGTGDDRRLNIFLKTMVKWAKSTENSPDEDKLMCDKLLAQLSLCEFAAKKSERLEVNHKKQLGNYKEMQGKLDQLIKEVKETIAQSKNNLKNAKILKHNRMSYDLLAQSIKEQPDRKETNKKLDKLKKELEELQDKSNCLENKLESRRKDFFVFITSANRLSAMLEDSLDEDNIDTSLDDVTNSPGPEPMSE